MFSCRDGCSHFVGGKRRLTVFLAKLLLVQFALQFPCRAELGINTLPFVQILDWIVFWRGGLQYYGVADSCLVEWYETRPIVLVVLLVELPKLSNFELR